MKAAEWYGDGYFIGRIQIGRVTRDCKPGPNGEPWVALCYLPGASQVIGRFHSDAEGREAVEKSSNSRIKGMFGAGIETTAAAVREGRALRVVGRAIYLAGVWTCDRPVDARAMFEDLRQALNLAPEHAPRANPDKTGAGYSSDQPPAPEALEVVE